MVLLVVTTGRLIQGPFHEHSLNLDMYYRPTSSVIVNMYRAKSLFDIQGTGRMV